MSVPELPFWLINEYGRAPNATDKMSDRARCQAHIFTRADGLIGYMAAQQDRRLTGNQIAERQEVILAMADLHRQGMETLAIDPNPDGSGGKIMRIADVVAAYRM